MEEEEEEEGEDRLFGIQYIRSGVGLGWIGLGGGENWPHTSSLGAILHMPSQVSFAHEKANGRRGKPI